MQFIPVMMLKDGDLNTNFCYPIAVEYKFDGERLQIHKKDDIIKIYSKRGKDVTKYYDEIVNEFLRFSFDFIVEGEVVPCSGGKILSYNYLNRRKLKNNKHDIDVILYLFDILAFNNINLMNKKYNFRHKLLVDKFVESEIIKISKNKILVSSYDLEREFKEAEEKGYEGIVVKDLESKYLPGIRSSAWVKIKRKKELTGIIYGGKFNKSGKIMNSFAIAIKSGDSLIHATNVCINDKILLMIILNKCKPSTKIYIQNKNLDRYFEPEVKISIYYEGLFKKVDGFFIRSPRVKCLSNSPISELNSLKIENY